MTQHQTIPDAELVRLLDGELDAREAELLRTRVAAQPSAQRRLEQLELRSRNLARLLYDAAPDDLQVRRSATRIAPTFERTAPERNRWLQAAVIASLLLGTALFVPPVRAWIIEQITSIRTPDPAPVPEAVIPTATSDGPDARVRFAISSSTFELRVPALRGSLTIERAEGNSGSIEVTGVAELRHAVSQDRVELMGLPQSAPRYRLTLPATVTEVIVRAADGATITRSVPTGGLSIELER